ncbi:MAG: hypothetical protein A2785_01640 [Candidatus Chisholmbacteria bacterium RIFCSPHIGHO2_01_FULL_49_18]|uniref:Uncharacterized protein n=2 Tax=Candidatus Chisholmiibacteriota TaxID=1817900 RepID=A0A1G1VLN0_9BACT|nr:MAG: hypothetical protein A2785_01640 [Candidatus Chisholmbacteria bacterium RIFCSPHIGHO2_01_FULL_49_18]OGY21752.1 MAG: hypothetical protein A3A65_02175 [Candidatus Chisholmbacteria bacterium RIFCSPLOWO2_01_FULL_49_14]
MNSFLKFAALPLVGLYRAIIFAPDGFRAMSEEGELLKTNIVVFFGNVCRWGYIWAIAKLDEVTLSVSAAGMMGNAPMSVLFNAIVPRAIISLILSVLVTAASWKWLREHFSPAHAKWVAFFLGFWAEPTVGVLGTLFRLITTGAWT